MTDTPEHPRTVLFVLLAHPHAKFAISTTLLLFICLMIWIDMPQGLFAGTDGRLYKNLIAAQIQFTKPFSVNAINPFQGMGNQFIP